jgi:hypothetical protein
MVLLSLAQRPTALNLEAGRGIIFVFVFPHICNLSNAGGVQHAQQHCHHVHLPPVDLELLELGGFHAQFLP